MQSHDANIRVTGRLAPSPTGRLHLGNAWAFLCAWLGARSRGGDLLLRIEDIDPQRSKDEYVDSLQEDLLWLGLSWNGTPLRQSERLERYAEALHFLEKRGLVYPCFCTRKELRELAGAPQAGLTLEPAYSGRCRSLGQQEVAANKAAGKHYSLRLRFDVESSPHLAFNDLCLGPVALSPDEAGSDFPLCRSDGVFAYQLAVVLDDMDSGVTQVVRGADILTSTPRQLYLYELFGAAPPEYAHVPLLLDHEGERLAKRHASLSVSAMREAGVRPEEIIGYLAHWSGLAESPTPIRPRELLKGFDFKRIRHDVSRLPQDLSSVFPALG